LGLVTPFAKVILLGATGDYIFLRVSIFKCAVVAVEVIKGGIEDALHLFSRHLSLQYFTSSQFLAHFLRHSKGRLQRWQVLGANPFLTLATRDIMQF